MSVPKIAIDVEQRRFSLGDVSAVLGTLELADAYIERLERGLRDVTAWLDDLRRRSYRATRERRRELRRLRRRPSRGWRHHVRRKKAEAEAEER